MTKSEAIQKARATSKANGRTMAAVYNDDYGTYHIAEWGTFIVGVEGYAPAEIIAIFHDGKAVN